MSKEQVSYSEITSADKTAIGFDFQYYFFLWKLLALEPNQTIGWETEDDIHIKIGNEEYFYQIKHSIQKNKSGEPKNFTTYDKDLWKTISMWIKIITDEADARKEIIDQKLFLKNKTFILATNKSATKGNKFLEELCEFQKETKDISNFIAGLKLLKKGTEDKYLKNYINTILNLDESVLSDFLKKIEFELNQSDIFEKCYNAIKADKIEDDYIEELFQQIDSAVKKDSFINISNGKKVQISFEDYYKRYRKYYEIARNPSLKITPFTGALPAKLEEQIFIKQLIDIQDIDKSFFEDIVEFTRFKLEVQTNLNSWHQNGEITLEELEEFKLEAIIQWKNEFRPRYRGLISDGNINKLALEILDSIRKIKLLISRQELNTAFSNGYFYSLSDEPVIGWKKDWESKYKNEN